jgi:plastocyanin
VSHPTGPVRSPRRTATLMLALGVGLLSGCAMDDDAAGTADAAPSAGAEAGSSAAAPASPGSSSPTEAESATVGVTAEDFSFDLAEDSFAAGEYTFELTNAGGASHDLVIERDGEDVAATDIVSPGSSDSVTVTLEPGEYVLYCSVGNHRSMGMEVPVTVTG